MGCGVSKDSGDPWQLAASGQAKQLERWLRLGGNPSALDRQGGRGTLLHAAVQSDSLSCVKVLLKEGADVNAVTKLRGSPLHAAALLSSPAMVNVLLEGGADPLLKNAEGKTAIDVAAARGNVDAAGLMRGAAAAARRRPDGGRARPSPGGAAAAAAATALRTQPSGQSGASVSSPTRGGSAASSAQTTVARAAVAQQPALQNGQRQGLAAAGSGLSGRSSGSASAAVTPGRQPGTPAAADTPPPPLADPVAMPASGAPAGPPLQQAQQQQPGSATAAGGGAASHLPAFAPLRPAASPRSDAVAAFAAAPPAWQQPDAANAPPAPPLQPHAGQLAAGHAGWVASPPQALQPPQAPTADGRSPLEQLAGLAVPAVQPATLSDMAEALGLAELSTQPLPPPTPPTAAAARPAATPALPGAAVSLPAAAAAPRPLASLPEEGEAAAAPPAAATAAAAAVGDSDEHDLYTISTAGTASSGDSSNQARGLLENDPLLTWASRQHALGRAAAGDGGAPPAVSPFADAALPPQPSGGLPSPSGGGSGPLEGGGLAGAGPSGGSSGFNHRLSSGASMVDIKPWEIDYGDLVMNGSIGEGSFGKVYRAKWHETPVAVKLLFSLQDTKQDPGEAALTLSNPILFNLQKECGLMASLRHPNVVQFMGVSAVPPAMITEYCGRGSLTDVLKGGRRLPEKAALLTWSRRLNLALDAAKGMLYLHRRGIVHRDLKSPNLLVDSTWRVKVADFNLSKIIEDSGTASGGIASGTKTGTMAGANPKWLAPEVLEGRRSTEASDVFSFGVVLWELMTWTIPWEKVSPWTVVAQLMAGSRLPLPESHEELPGVPADNAAFAPCLPAYRRLVEACWEQDPAERPSFEEIIHQLRRMYESAVQGRNS